MTTDPELLRQFAQTNSEAAFAELVKRHVNLVYSAALRQVNGDAHLAQDVAQTVFTDLARKAASLVRRENLTGWLYTSAHFAAAKIVRGEIRRRDREENFMRESEGSGTGVPPVQSADEQAEWENLRPLLDAAMHELKEADREAILLRYFENQPFIQVGAELGLNENAARMRVERALEKLRALLAKRGVTTATALATVISANAVQIAPVNLIATLTTTSIAAAGTGTLTLMKIMTLTKLKLGISALVLAGAATALVVQHQAQEKIRGENGLLQQQLAQLQTDSTDFSKRLAAADESKKLPDDQFNELLKLRGQVGVLRRQASESKAAQNQKAQTAEQELAKVLSAEAKFTANESATINAMKYIGLDMRMYAVDHANQFPTNDNLHQLVKDYDDNKNLLIGIPAIEFMNAGSIKFISEDKLEHPNMVVLRERIVRQSPDGTWRRNYLFADGSVQIATSYDGNFDAWEKANTYSPPPSQ